MTPRNLAVVTAGLSQPSSTRLLADRLADATKGVLDGQGDPADVAVVDLRDHAHDLVNAMLTGVPTGDLRWALDSVSGAEGLIAVSPIFNASYSGLFKSFFDVVDADALTGTPVLIGATGGTPRHSLALEHAMRPMFAHLRSIVVPTAVYAASEDWGTGGGTRALTDRIGRAAAELAALVGGRGAPDSTDPFADPTPFSELLAGPE
ncbi:FMN reductase [Murinocardiopsis flavida]|uniref:FMN reductase n=1 Tax=Murinocardiopsis flavida TaxID=645275 RepID=A0A2P8CLU6_9ACTN|nr:FMN reductase [Murinocardiopsis flavida]PSK85945.1 FMN reductase [Murinocardiopsis flavida]